MAGLADLNLEDAIRTIKTPSGGSFTVRGLALSDITRIVRINAPHIEGFFQRFMGENAALMESADPKFAALGAATKFGKGLLDEAPGLAADIIAHASDEPTLAHKVKALPFPTQLEALEAVAELTFVGEDGIKKAAETVIRMLSGATTLLEGQNLSQIGTLQSEDKSVSS